MAGNKTKVASTYADASLDDSMLKRGLSKVPALVKAAIGAAAVASGAQQASANTKFNQLVRSTGEAAGWTSEQLAHMRNEMRKVSSFSNTDIASAQSALLTYTNVKGEQFKKALTAAGNVSKVLGQDLTSTAQELGELLTDPLKAAEGGLEKYGIRLGLAEQGQIRNAVASRDFARAQEVVLAHFDRFKGAAAEAANTGVGGFEKLKNSLSAAFMQITGVLPDLGAMAARVADVLDRFMQLKTVQFVITSIRETWETLSSSVTKFIEDNRSDFEQWGTLIKEIATNVGDFLRGVWEGMKAAFSAVLGAMGTNWNEVWTEIKTFITETLDEISLVTSNFGLGMEYVWTKIKLGAMTLWDNLRDGLALVAIGWEAIWGGMVAGAQNAFDQISSIFTGEKTKSWSEAVGEGFMAGGDRGRARWNVGPSDTQKQLRGEVESLRAQLEAGRKKIRETRDAVQKDRNERQEEKKKQLETPGKGTPYVNTKPFQFEFTGFAELAKKIQSSIYPSEAIQLQKLGVEAAKKAAANGDVANGHLAKIVEQTKGGQGRFAP